VGLSINRPTKRGKEKSPSDGHCECEKEIDNHLQVCQQILTESHIVTRLTNERASSLNMNDINDISFFGMSDCYHYIINVCTIHVCLSITQVLKDTYFGLDKKRRKKEGNKAACCIC
jgi:hypothetical protein